MKPNELEIKQVAPAELIAAEYNPREMTVDQVAALTDSVKRFGLVDPLIVNKHKGRENIVIGGHQRLRIATVMGFATVPVVYLDLTEAKERELNIRLNRNTGQWDWDGLANFFEIDELKGWGFSKSDLNLEVFTHTDGNLPGDLPEVDIQGEVDGMNEWVVVRFEAPADYEDLCKLLSLRPGSRTVQYEQIKQYIPNSNPE
jgi:hypothetical protein